MSQYSPWETVPIVTQPILSSMVCLHSSAIGRDTGVLVTLITVTLGTMTDQFRPKFQPTSSGNLYRCRNSHSQKVHSSHIYIVCDWNLNGLLVLTFHSYCYT